MALDEREPLKKRQSSPGAPTFNLNPQMTQTFYYGHTFFHYLNSNLLPTSGAPYLQVSAQTDNDGLILDACILPQIVGQGDAALLIRDTDQSSRKHQAGESPGIPASERKPTSHFLCKPAPFFGRVDEQASLDSPGQSQSSTKLSTKLGGNSQSSASVGSTMKLTQ